MDISTVLGRLMMTFPAPSEVAKAAEQKAPAAAVSEEAKKEYTKSCASCHAKDGKGNACDDKDSRLTENKGLIWGVLLGTILIVGFLAWRLSKKPLK